MEKKLAKNLLEIEAVKINTQNLFTWASGIKSPIYCDNRQILSFPHIRNYVKNLMIELIQQKFPNVNAIAAVATGAIAMGALIADTMNLPFVYVRSKPKDHGMHNLIEGKIDVNANAVVVEDLISTGGSSLFVVDTLRNKNINVLGLVAIFSYNLNTSQKSFEDSNCQKYTLTNFDVLINNAKEMNYISEIDVDFLIKWRNNLQ